MKHFSTYTVILVMTLLSLLPLNVTAGNNLSSYSFPLTKHLNSEFNSDIENEDTKHRAPSRPITCSINQDSGIVIPNVDTADIDSFEVYDENQMCIASFVDEEEFISFIFSYTGAAEIHLNFDTYTLTGYISL